MVHVVEPPLWVSPLLPAKEGERRRGERGEGRREREKEMVRVVRRNHSDIFISSSHEKSQFENTCTYVF